MGAPVSPADSTGVLIRKRPSGATAKGAKPVTRTLKRKTGRPGSNSGEVLTGAAYILSRPADRKKISFPSRDHCGLSPPSVETIHLRAPAQGFRPGRNSRTYTSRRPVSSEL